MAELTRGYAHRIDVNAPLEMLWRGLIDPLKLRLWYGPDARVTAREGGGYFVRAASDLDREAHIDVFDPGRRLRLIYMTPPALRGEDAVLVDDFVLTREGQLAVLHVLGSGFPVEESWDIYYNRLRTGWPRALARLKVLTERESRELMKAGQPGAKAAAEPAQRAEPAEPAEPAATAGPAAGSSAGPFGSWLP
jgi:uncharacterized protein YndB with AHSA1/START domain